MVGLGYFETPANMPVPDMSFVRLFDDTEVGWTHRGQYAIWCGKYAQTDVTTPTYRLLERVEGKVLSMEEIGGAPVFHKINRRTSFLIEGLLGFWMRLDSDAIWLDTPGDNCRYAFLAIGGAKGKPSQLTVDWTCTACAHPIGGSTIQVARQGFLRALEQGSRMLEEFNSDEALRTCNNCGATHPAVTSEYHS